VAVRVAAVARVVAAARVVAVRVAAVARVAGARAAATAKVAARLARARAARAAAWRRHQQLSMSSARPPCEVAKGATCLHVPYLRTLFVSRHT